MIKVGIIGGSGLENPDILKSPIKKKIETPYGDPSSEFTIGKIGEIEVVILSRHGIKHTIPPTQVNNRANTKLISGTTQTLKAPDHEVETNRNVILKLLQE